MNHDIPSPTVEPAFFLPSPHLVALLEEMKHPGELQGLDEKRRMEAIVARINAATALGNDSPSSSPSIKLTPEFAEILRRIEALLEMTRSGPLAELNEEQVMLAIVSWRRAEVQRQKRANPEPSPFRPDPEFAEVLGRIDAARDAEGVPDNLKAVEGRLPHGVHSASDSEIAVSGEIRTGRVDSGGASHRRDGGLCAIPTVGNDLGPPQ